MHQSPPIVIVTGAMASGKTTLIEALKSKYGDSTILSLSFLDMDSVGVPDTDREHWRRNRVEELLDQAIRLSSIGKPVMVFGLIFPNEIIGSPHFDPQLNLSFILLNAPDDVLTTRLRARMKELGELDKFDQVLRNNLYIAGRLRKEVPAMRSYLVLENADLSISSLLETTETWLAKSNSAPGKSS